MVRWVARGLDAAIVRAVNRPGRFDVAAPSRAPVAEARSVGPEEIRRLVLDGAVRGRVPLPDGRPLRALALSFPSSAPPPGVERDLVSGVLFRPRGRPRGAVLLVPGWLARFRWWFVAAASRIARRGRLAALIDLPGHFGRARPGAGSGGEFVTADVARTAAHLRQAVADVRAVLGALAGELAAPADAVVLGFSLGGWAAGVAAGLEGTSALLVTPAADPGRMLLESPLLGEVRAALARAGHDVEGLGRAAAPLALRALPAPAGRTLLLGGAWDAITPRAHLEELAAAWRAPLELHPEGHLSVYVSPRFVARLGRALEER